MIVRPTGLLVIAVVAASQAAAAPDFAPAVKADYDRHLEALFVDFHRNPELSYLEARTAKVMAKELRAVGGIDVTEGIGGTAVVGVLRNGPRAVVLVRLGAVGGCSAGGPPAPAGGRRGVPRLSRGLLPRLPPRPLAGHG